MNYFVMTFAVKAHCLCRFGLGFAFAQHRKDARSHRARLCALPNAGKVFPFELLKYGFDSMACKLAKCVAMTSAAQQGRF